MLPCFLHMISAGSGDSSVHVPGAAMGNNGCGRAGQALGDQRHARRDEGNGLIWAAHAATEISNVDDLAGRQGPTR